MVLMWAGLAANTPISVLAPAMMRDSSVSARQTTARNYSLDFLKNKA